MSAEPDPRPNGALLRFGVFEADLRAGELRKQGMRIRLQEQPFQVLAVLLENPGEVVTREELQKRLWPSDTYVDFDQGLNKAIKKLRDALGDSAESPRFVETVARRGYRFLVEVKSGASSVPADSSASDAQGPASSSARSASDRFLRLPGLRIAGVVAGVFLVVAGIVAWKLSPAQDSAPPIRSLAVLPFQNLSNEAAQEFFADGMTDQLISDLGQISALRVISRTSAMTYKGARKPLPQIARELDVDAVVEGTVLRSGDHVRITAQLVNAQEDKHLWSQSYEGELHETIQLQNQVAMAIAHQIRISLNPKEHAALTGSKSVNPEAYVSYLKGRFFWNKRTGENLKVALAYFNQAIVEDPTYAQAYSGLADTYALLGDWQYGVLTPKDALPRAKAAAMKAVQLDDSLGEAHTSLAFCLRSFDWDFPSAEKEFQQAIKLSPNYATAHHWYAWHLAIEHQNEPAIAEMKKALTLDPLSLVINADLAELLAIAHSYDDSIRQSKKTLEMDPNFALAYNHLGQAYLQKKLYNEAIAELRKAVQLSGESPTCIANLARAYAASGNRVEALKLLAGLKARSNSTYSHGTEMAIIYASLGAPDQAMQWLEKSYAEKFNPGVLLRPGFDPLRSDARFQNLLHRVGLTR